MTAPVAPPVSPLHHVADLDDPRTGRPTRHPPLGLIGLTRCAVIAGADARTAIGNYGRAKRGWLETFLDLPHGIPSHDTLGRVFAARDPAAFRDASLARLRAVASASRGTLVASDGGALRRSFDTAAGERAIHRVSAWARDDHRLLGQQQVPGKPNEITAIRAALTLLDLQGALVTIDARGCQTDIARRITTAGGDYVLAVKGNQPTLRADVQQVFRAGLGKDFAGLEHRSPRTTGRGHGRTATRQYHPVRVPAAVARKHPGFAGLRALGRVFSGRQVGGGPATAATRFHISSPDLKVTAFAEAVRGPRSAENNSHGAPAVAPQEDGSRVRKDHGPANLGLVRRIARSLRRQAPTAKKVGIAGKRKTAGWNDDFLVRVLLGRSAR